MHSLGADVEFEEPLVGDATSATVVRRVLAPLVEHSSTNGTASDVLLNYTGGTKVMAAHARMAYSDDGGQTPHASYLDEGSVRAPPRLRFDDGSSKALSEYDQIPFDLKTIFSLHGITYTPRRPKEPSPKVSDAREILCKVLRDLPLATALYCERERLEDKEYKNPSNATAAPFCADQYGLNLSIPIFPTEELLEAAGNSDQRKSWFKQWYGFIGGEWLEEWVAEQVRNALDELDFRRDEAVCVGFDAFRGGSKNKQLEIDVAVVRAYRSYFISCTTDTTKTLCKSKLFEVAVRSRQLGGDLARAALVCLADDEVINKLRNEVDDVEKPKAAIHVPSVGDVHVFGLQDIRQWSDCGKQPNRYSLKEWLES
jgi:hypothetical protein